MLELLQRLLQLILRFLLSELGWAKGWVSMGLLPVVLLASFYHPDSFIQGDQNWEYVGRWKQKIFKLQTQVNILMYMQLHSQVFKLPGKIPYAGDTESLNMWKGQKHTEKDKNGQKRREPDRNGQKTTETDRNGQKRTETDRPLKYSMQLQLLWKSQEPWWCSCRRFGDR